MKFVVDVSVRGDDVDPVAVADWLLDFLCGLEDHECPDVIRSFDSVDVLRGDG